MGPKLAAHSGRPVKTTGEGFHTVLDEMVCASEMQAGSANTMHEQRNAFDLRAALVNRVLHAALCRNYGKLAVRLSLSRNRSMLPVLSGDMIDVGGYPTRRIPPF